MPNLIKIDAVFLEVDLSKDQWSQPLSHSQNAVNSQALYAHIFCKSLPCSKIHLYTLQSHLNSLYRHTVQPVNSKCMMSLTPITISTEPGAQNPLQKQFSLHVQHILSIKTRMSQTPNPGPLDPLR